MFFDTHAHYDDDQFDADREELLASMPSRGITMIVNPGCDLESSRKAVALADRFPHIYAAVGFHPHEAKSMDDDALNEIEKLAANDRVVAIGEIGLDYHYDFSPRDEQRICFRRQMQLAEKLNMPVIIHEREACADCLEILRDFRHVRGVFHCYSGSWETAKEILSWGWNISFTGAVTFKNARRAIEVVENMPLDRLMIETDSPYLAPVPMRGKRNDSSNLTYIAGKIAEIRGMKPEEIAALTMENGKKFFGI